jgi:tRNA-2-methylthio-N6-dimethylallyladenosine synthase
MEYVKYNFGYIRILNVREHWQEEKWKMTFRRNKSKKITRNCRFTTKHAWFRSENSLTNGRSFVEKFPKSTEEFSGRNSQSITVVFQKKIIKLGIL